MPFRVITGPAVVGPALATAVSANGRYLVDQYAQPFLIVGNSDSTITNVSVSDLAVAFQTRRASGFNWWMVEIIAGAYESSTGSPAWATFDGVVPFYQSDGGTLGTGPTNYDVTQPYLPYWQRIDSMFGLAQQYGITLFADLLGDCVYQDNPTFYANMGTTKLAAYATWFANRYKGYTYHHLWGQDHFSNITNGWTGVDPYISAMLNAVVAANARCLHCIENNDGVYDPGTEYNLTSDDTGFTFGTGTGQMNLNLMYDSRNNSPDTSRAYAISPATPVFFGEGLYDSSPPGKNTWSNLLNRRYLYFPMVNGACGSTYGNNNTWDYASGWQSYLVDTAVTHIGLWKTFMTSLAWWKLVPDTAATFVTSGNTYSSGSVGTNGAVSADGHLGLVYLDALGSVTVAMSKMANTVTAQWFDPTNANYTSAGGPFSNTGTHTFTTSADNAGGDPDWVLVLTA